MNYIVTGLLDLELKIYTKKKYIYFLDLFEFKLYVTKAYNGGRQITLFVFLN